MLIGECATNYLEEHRSKLYYHDSSKEKIIEDQQDQPHLRGCQSTNY